MLDVIIPAYNAKVTIERTLASLASQTEAKKLKVHIINDGSDYSYSKWVERYIPAFKSIDEMYTPTRSGPGAARQYGIDNTSEPYILFIDADDTLGDSYSIYQLLKPIKANKLIDMTWGPGIEECYSIELPADAEYGTDPFLKCPDLALHLHGKIYKRSLLANNDIRFDNSETHEDIIFNILVLAYTTNIAKTDHYVYCHHYNAMSITRGEQYGYLQKLTNKKANTTMFEQYHLLIEKFDKRGITPNTTVYESFVFELSMLYLKYCTYLKENNQDDLSWFMDKSKIFFKECILSMYGTDYEYILDNLINIDYYNMDEPSIKTFVQMLKDACL